MGFLDMFKKKEIKIEDKSVAPKLDEIRCSSLSEDDFGVDELVELGSIIDTEDPDVIVKFKHNLKVLIKITKEHGRIDNLFLIREDDILPLEHEWILSSKNTTLEHTVVGLSTEIKAEQAKRNGNLIKKVNGIELPYDEKKFYEELSKLDKKYASLLLPSHFRSTKHFTVNTPLGFTGDYNSVSTNRNFIVIDSIDNFLASDYGYSIAYHDAYLDIAHEGLKISDKAIILINDEKYASIMSDPEYKSELSKYRVIRFKGDEDIAICMVLTELGGLPSQIGMIYAEYDNQLNQIIDKTIQLVARENNLLFDQSHGGDVFRGAGHFSNYYDEKNQGFNESLEIVARYLSERFGISINVMDIFKPDRAAMLIKKVGFEELKSVIDDFNRMMSDKFKDKLEAYRIDRSSITPDVHNLFVITLNLIGEYYDNRDGYDISNENELEEAIRLFIQGDTVAEQIYAANVVNTMIKVKELEEEKKSSLRI